MDNLNRVKNPEMLGKEKTSGTALLPILFFILVYVGTGIIMTIKGVEDPFYQISPVTAIALGVIFAFIIIKGRYNDKFDSFIAGCGGKDMVMMLNIFLCTGAFSTVSSAMGGVDSVVNLALSFVPHQLLIAGVFVISCFISMGTGTSLGTIGALSAIAVDLADKAQLSMPMMLGALVSGSLFGDNLSMISDTTIAATRTQNCELRDKFRMNFLIALPAAVLSIILYSIFGLGDAGTVDLGELEYGVVKTLPYIIVLVLALVGRDVYKVLMLGTAISGIIGMCYGDLTLIGALQNVYDGFAGMLEVFLCSFLMGGLAQMISDAGGVNWLLQKLLKRVHGKRSAEATTFALSFLTNCAIANNTVSIIVAGPTIKKIADKYQLDPRRVASLLDISCCVSDGVIPHGTQIIMAGGMAVSMGFSLSPIEIIPFLWYLELLAVFAIISIFVPYANRLIRKDPWNFELDMAQRKVDAMKAEEAKSTER